MLFCFWNTSTAKLLNPKEKPRWLATPPHIFGGIFTSNLGVSWWTRIWIQTGWWKTSNLKNNQPKDPQGPSNWKGEWMNLYFPQGWVFRSSKWRQAFEGPMISMIQIGQPKTLDWNLFEDFSGAWWNLGAEFWGRIFSKNRRLHFDQWGIFALETFLPEVVHSEWAPLKNDGLYKTLRIRLCVLRVRDFPHNPILFGWDVSTVNPTRARRVGGFLGLV